MKNISRNFEALFLSATAAQLETGLMWYETAHNVAKRLSDSTDGKITLRQACGVI